MTIKKWLTRIWQLLRRSTHQRAEVIPFPQKETPAMPSFKRYLIETLKMKGIHIKIDIQIASMPVDIFLPDKQMVIYCVEHDEDPLQKIRVQQLRHHTKSMGLRLVVVTRDDFYKGLNTTFFKLKQQRIISKP